MSMHLEFNAPLATVILSALGNQSRVDLLLHLARENERHPELLPHMEHFATAFSICRENRNIVVHSAARLDSSMDIIGLEKASRSKLGHTVSYAYDPKEISRVCDDIQALRGYASVIIAAVCLPLAYRVLRFEGKDIGDKDKPRPLPEIPPLPRKLMPLAPG